jgi:homoserine O-acetyltransferase
MSMKNQKTITINPPFVFKNGHCFNDPISIAYETHGKLNDKKDNAILVTTGLSPSAHICSSAEDQSHGWWEKIVGDGKYIDTRKYFVICINSLGSCYGSSGPASYKPGSEEKYGLSFPEVTIEDIALSMKPVIDELGIKTLHSIIGPSMGGMTAMSLVKQFPSITTNLILISTAAACRPFSIAVRSLQRKLITSDQNWESGNYRDTDLPLNGMKQARYLGMVTYRSPTEWNNRFGRKKSEMTPRSEDFSSNRFEIQDYLKSRSDDFVSDFDPNSYLYLSRCIDTFDLMEENESIEEVFQNFNMDRVLILGVDEDYIFPFDCLEELSDGFKSAFKEVSIKKLPSLSGHDSFLVDHENFGSSINEFLEAL